MKGDFTTELITEVSRQRETIESVFSTPAEDPEDLGEQVEQHWHAQPSGEAGSEVPKFAVDGSRVTRQFSNGAELLICQALMIGGEGGSNESYNEVVLDVYRGPGNPDVTQRYARLISHLTEIKVILDNWSQIPESSVIYIDGSIHGRYLHSLWPFSLDGREDVPLQLLRQHIELLNRAASKNVLLIGISKTSQVRALASQLNTSVPDTELLYKHTESPGVSTPILLCGYGFDRDEFKWLQTDPEQFADRICSGSVSKDEALATIQNLRDSPGIVTFHTRMQQNQETIRVDVPATALGIEKSITACNMELLSPAVIEKVFTHIVADYGGPTVYNSLLYTVDELVRLNQETVDEVYLQVLRDEIGAEFELTRSYRRFQ